jgi:hypothetical protein
MCSRLAEAGVAFEKRNPLDNVTNGEAASLLVADNRARRRTQPASVKKRFMAFETGIGNHPSESALRFQFLAAQAYHDSPKDRRHPACA